MSHVTIKEAIESVEPSPIAGHDETARSAFGVGGVIRGQFVGLLLSEYERRCDDFLRKSVVEG